MYRLTAIQKDDGSFYKCNGRRVYKLSYNNAFVSYIMANKHHRWCESFGSRKGEPIVWFMNNHGTIYEYPNLYQVCDVWNTQSIINGV